MILSPRTPTLPPRSSSDAATASTKSTGYLQATSPRTSPDNSEANLNENKVDNSVDPAVANPEKAINPKTIPTDKKAFNNQLFDFTEN